MPDPEEVLTNVLADMFEPWEPASPRTIAFSKMLRAKLDERGIRLARVVPEDRPAQGEALRWRRLLSALDEMDPDICAFCRDVYCSGTNCIEDLDADDPKREAEVERLQDLVLVGRTVRDLLDELGPEIAAEIGAGVPVLDDDTRREVPEVLLTFAKWADWYLEDGCRRDHHGYCQSHGLDEDCPVGPMREWLAAYLGRTDGR